MKKYFSLIEFREVKVEDAKLLLNWRTKRRISKFMLTDISKSLNKQKNWILTSYKKKNYYHWIILFKKKPIGFLSINNINLKKKTTCWSWYLGNTKYLMIAAMIPPFFYNWIFRNTKIDKILAIVFENNLNVIKILMLHGYKILNKKITYLKKGKKIQIIQMVLYKKKWNFDKFKKYVTPFPVKKWINFSLQKY